MYRDKKMKGYKMGKVGETKFHTKATPYANENAVYGKKRADMKSKMPRPDVSAFK